MKTYTKADLKMVFLMVKASIFGQMEQDIKVNLYLDLEMEKDC